MNLLRLNFSISHHAIQLFGQYLFIPFQRNTYLACIPSIHTLNFPHSPKPQLLIDPQIRHSLGTLQIAWHALSIRSLSNHIHQHPSNPHPPYTRIDRDRITEVVSTRIRPNIIVRLFLRTLPHLIPTNIQSPTTQVANIAEELPEG